MIIRAMRDADCAAVVQLVHDLAEQSGVRAGLTEAALRIECRAGAVIEVTVAEAAGSVCGACLGLITYSTWRGARGLYIVDLIVRPDMRGQNTGERLLRAAALRGARRGAQFVKLEVDVVNTGAARFYQRLGFVRNDGDRLFVQEADMMADFCATQSSDR